MLVDFLAWPNVINTLSIIAAYKQFSNQLFGLAL